MTDSDRLSEIRKKFVGSGEDHAVLGRLCDEYREAYDRGAKDREAEIIDKARADDDALQFARTISNLAYQAKRFITWDGYHDPSDHYYLKETADWLRSIGRTPEQMRALADEMERVEKPAEAVL